MAADVDIRGPLLERFDEVLTDDALSFVAELQRRFDGRRRARGSCSARNSVTSRTRPAKASARAAHAGSSRSVCA